MMQVKNLSYHYKGCPEVLKDVSFDMEPGKFLAILGGATLLLLGDLFARTVTSPVILPIGAITSFLGGPLFLYLLFKGGKKQ